MSESILGVGIGLFVVVFFVASCIWSYFAEKKLVLSGHCGLPWQNYDMNSQGGIGLKCQKCDAGTWVSWYRKGFVTKRWAR